MAQGQKPAFEVFSSRDDGKGGNRYTKLGVAWNVAKDGISIKLDALPITNSIVLFPIREKED